MKKRVEQRRGKDGGKGGGGRRDAAEMLAVSALAFLASEPDRLGQFLAASGMGPGDMRAAAKDPQFLAGVLEHVMGDEQLLVAFAAHLDIDPTEIARAGAAMGVAPWERDIP
jgi:hypothetical protein